MEKKSTEDKIDEIHTAVIQMKATMEADKTICANVHAIVLFTDPKTGRRGYIDAEYVRRYEPTTPWADVVANEPRWQPKGWRLEPQGD
jgi:hypothetical protein